LQYLDFAGIFISFIVLLFSLTVHEMAHAWTADRLGDPTARLLGRVSLNPIVHADPIGTVVFPLVSMVSGAMLIGLLLGAVGAVIGTFGGATMRAWLAQAFGKDLPAALLEDVIAIGGAILILSRFA